MWMKSKGTKQWMKEIYLRFQRYVTEHEGE